MNTSRRQWKASETRALLYLWRLAAAHGGYPLRGVRGWAHFENVQEGAGLRLSEVLPLLHKLGVVDRVDVRTPGRARPVWLYRANDAGARIASELAGTPFHRLDQPGPPECNGPVYLPDRQRGALLLLRQAHDEQAAPVRFGARGWVTGRELGRRKETWNEERGGPPFLAVDTTDLRWLAGWGLIERRDEPAPAGRQLAVVYWRVTELRRGIKLLHGREPTTNAAMLLRDLQRG
jgi:hypothetical protein